MKNTTNDNLSLHRVTRMNDEAFLCLKIYQYQYSLLIPMQAESHGIISRDMGNSLEIS